MKRYLILAYVFLIALLLTGCQEGATGQLSGKATVGPLQPVVREGEVEPTPPPEVFTTRGINIFKPDGTTLVKKVMFDEQGNYTVELPVGRYVINLVPSGIDFSKELPAEVQIEEGQTTLLNIDIDTGIR